MWVVKMTASSWQGISILPMGLKGENHNPSQKKLVSGGVNHTPVLFPNDEKIQAMRLETYKAEWVVQNENIIVPGERHFQKWIG